MISTILGVVFITDLVVVLAMGLAVVVVVVVVVAAMVDGPKKFPPKRACNKLAPRP